MGQPTICGCAFSDGGTIWSIGRLHQAESKCLQLMSSPFHLSLHQGLVFFPLMLLYSGLVKTAMIKGCVWSLFRCPTLRKTGPCYSTELCTGLGPLLTRL